LSNAGAVLGFEWRVRKVRFGGWSRPWLPKTLRYWHNRSSMESMEREWYPGRQIRAESKPKEERSGRMESGHAERGGGGAGRSHTCALGKGKGKEMEGANERRACAHGMQKHKGENAASPNSKQRPSKRGFRKKPSPQGEQQTGAFAPSGPVGARRSPDLHPNVSTYMHTRGREKKHTRCRLIRLKVA
jgi:hypothetical protein